MLPRKPATRWFGIVLATSISLFVWLMGCSSTPPMELEEKPTVVLVHDIFQKSLSWTRVTSVLFRQDYDVATPDLPGQGKDTTPLLEVTFPMYVEKVRKFVEEQSGRVILVGQGLSGVIISAVAEAIPDRIAKLVYLGAILPKNGDTIFNHVMLDRDNGFTKKNFLTDLNANRVRIAKDELPQLFSVNQTDFVGAQVLQYYQDNALSPLLAPVSLTEERFGSVRKVYIFVSGDKVVSLPAQVRMARDSVSAVGNIGGGHAATVLYPDELAKLFTIL